MKNNYSIKAESIKPSATLVISNMANELKERGADIISLSIGEPDFSTPEYIIDRTKEALSEGKTKYSPVSGVSDLKKAIAWKFLTENNLKYDLNRIVVSSGAKSSLFHVFYALLNDGDEVIIPSPYWLSYPEMVELCGGKSVFVRTLPENSYKITAKQLSSAITPKTKCFVLNSPNNPTGVVYSKEELEAIARVVVENDIFVVSDEVYEKFVFNGKKHISIASLNDDIYKKTITVNAVSKTYAMTGFRVGYIGASEEIAKIVTNVQSHTTSGATTFSQFAAAAAIKENNSEDKKIIEEYSERRTALLCALSALDGVSFVEPDGAFYVMLNVSGYYGKKYDGRVIADSVDFCKELLNEGVAVVPGRPFGCDEAVRLAYTVEKSKIESAVRRIGAFLKKLS
ncbi:MAG: pyridoxal phosphate-dependent aminotransferase [Christensenellaceae bacterium]|nr:pyridoxal phosphate-dependent aminotransferase [Christensenellaceae bacterium]MDD6926869.1 pyridoxal phosphate-dependent aminotransferase [bacterium]